MLIAQVLLIVFGFLGPQDLLVCRLVCWKWSTAASCGSLWQAACELRYPSARKRSGHCSWMHWYFENERRCRFVEDKRAEREIVSSSRLASAGAEDTGLQDNEKTPSGTNGMEEVWCSVCGVQYLRCLNKLGACMRHPGRLDGSRWTCCNAAVQRTQIYGASFLGTPAAARGCTPHLHEEACG